MCRRVLKCSMIHHKAMFPVEVLHGRYTCCLCLSQRLLQTPYSMPRRTSSWLYFFATQALFKRIQDVVTTSSNFVRCLIGMVLASLHPTIFDPLHRAITPPCSVVLNVVG